MTGALATARYRKGSLATRHCSNCKHYAATTKAGEGRCAENDGAAVHWQDVCDKWKARHA